MHGRDSQVAKTSCTFLLFSFLGWGPYGGSYDHIYDCVCRLCGILNYTYTGMDFRHDHNMDVPLGEVWDHRGDLVVVMFYIFNGFLVLIFDEKDRWVFIHVFICRCWTKWLGGQCFPC
jgi:hypothetical protein